VAGQQAGQGERRRQVQAGVDQRGQRPGRPIASGRPSMVCPVSRRTRSGPATSPVIQIAEQRHRHHRDAGVEGDRGGVQRHVAPRSGRNGAASTRRATYHLVLLHTH
jgi:hypothetical protein